MASSDPKPRREKLPAATARPVRTLVLSIGLFFMLDGALFRSGLYAGFEDPRPPAGSMMSIIHFTRATQSDPKRDVLVMGNSRIQYGFGPGYVYEAFPHFHYQMIMGAFPASNEEHWYYALHRIDPDHDRYAAIVIPISGYTITPHSEDYSREYETAQMLAPIIPLSHLREFLDGFGDQNLRWRAAMLALFPSHNYASDLAEFILHPAARMDHIAERNLVGIRYLYNEGGDPATMEDLKVDPKTNTIVRFPARFNVLYQAEMNKHFVAPPAGLARQWTERNAAFEAKWLGKIVSAYKNSTTRLIFIDMPHQPVPIPEQQPIPDAPDIRGMIPRGSNITVLPPETFEALQKPKYFLDLNHMNVFGRKAFSVQLGQAVNDILSARPLHSESLRCCSRNSGPGVEDISTEGLTQCLHVWPLPAIVVQPC